MEVIYSDFVYVIQGIHFLEELWVWQSFVSLHKARCALRNTAGCFCFGEVYSKDLHASYLTVFTFLWLDHESLFSIFNECYVR